MSFLPVSCLVHSTCLYIFIDLQPNSLNDEENQNNIIKLSEIDKIEEQAILEDQEQGFSLVQGVLDEKEENDEEMQEEKMEMDFEDEPTEETAAPKNRLKRLKVGKRKKSDKELEFAFEEDEKEEIADNEENLENEDPLNKEKICQFS